MPFDGSGNFNRDFPLGGWAGEAAAGVKIRSDHHDTHDEDLAHGLSNVICKDGQSQPTADISLNGHKLINVLNPSNPQDAATMEYVKGFRDFETSITIGGADNNGRVVFSSLTGANGLQWHGTDLSWLARLADTDKTNHRLVLNNDETGNGTDVVILDRLGNANLTEALTWNLSHDGAKWRTIDPGLATRITVKGGGFKLGGLDAATITDQYKDVSTLLRDYYTVTNSLGTIYSDFVKSASAKTVGFRSWLYNAAGNKPRWLMQLGDTSAETGTASAGSNFLLSGYNDAGTLVNCLHFYRATGNATFYGTTVTIMGTLTIDDKLLITNGAQADTFQATNDVFAGTTNQIVFRPVGPTDIAGQAVITAAGDMTLTRYMICDGYRGKVGTGGSYGAYYNNFNYTGNLAYYANTGFVGNVAFGAILDYRAMKDVVPLGSTWDKVKALRPVAFSYRDFGEIANDDTPRWGFVAHELGDTLLASAAEGEHDSPDMTQSANLIAVIAGLTRALQEAMLRIEALEAA